MLQRLMRSRALVAVFAALLLWGLVAGCSTGKKVSAPPPAKTEPKAPPASKPESEQPPPKLSRPLPQLPGVVGVMVENSPAARPQMGLDKADLVYEMEAEFGITRFLALFSQQKSEKIGPVRSARMGFYDVAVAYGMPYAHAGGNNDVLVELKERNRHLLNLDEIYTCGQCFWRISERKAPHNLYTSTDRLINHSKATGFSLKPMTWFPEGNQMTGGQPAEEIAFTWGPKTQSVAWTWNGKRYARSQSGEPHLMEDGAPILADNVITIFTEYRWNSAAQWGEGQNQIRIIGGGEGYLFRDGLRYLIRWYKASREEHFVLTTPEGKPVELAAGQTWFTVLKAKEHVTKGIPQ